MCVCVCVCVSVCVCVWPAVLAVMFLQVVHAHTANLIQVCLRASLVPRPLLPLRGSGPGTSLLCVPALTLPTAFMLIFLQSHCYACFVCAKCYMSSS